MAKKEKQEKKDKKKSLPTIWAGRDIKKMKRRDYEHELAKLEIELVKLQGWIKHKGLKVAGIC